MPVSSGGHVQFIRFQLYTMQLMFTVPGITVTTDSHNT